MENQLLAEAEAPDIDEYDGLSIRDIALAIANWPEGSEDQARALAALQARSPGRHHNRPPLDEMIDEELEPQKTRQSELIALAGKSVIIDDESASKVTDLVAIIGALERDLDEERKQRTRPYLNAQRLINDRYAAVIDPLRMARQGTDGRGGLRGMLTAYDDRKRREAEAERARIAEEARQREAEAAAARAAAEQAKSQGSSGVDAELTALRAEDEADRLSRRAEAIRPEPIRSHLGQVNRRREIRFDVENVRHLLGWLIKQPGLKSSIEQAARTIIGQHLKAIGVEVVERGVTIPGLKVWVEKGAANVRR